MRILELFLIIFMMMGTLLSTVAYSDSLLQAVKMEIPWCKTSGHFS